MKTVIEVEGEDIKRPSDRPPKTNWKIELIKKGLTVLQHASPRTAAEIIWHYFTMPGKTRFTDNQLSLLEKSDTSQSSYRGDLIKAYRWGNAEKKVLVCHGWRSKTADFRKIIERFVTEGYAVEGLDLRAHGKSEGKHTALPEYRDILKNHITKNGPYDIIIGYSIGALASGIVLSEMGKAFHPKHYYLIAGPPYVRYFFKDIVDDVGCSEAVYESMTQLVKTYYGQSIDYFDLRIKNNELKDLSTHLIYCEDDQIIPFQKGLELEECYPNASFVHTKGLGHYKIISNPAVIDYIVKSSRQ